MRETTSAIWSESASDSLIASPSSFMSCLSSWSTAPPGFTTLSLDATARPPVHAENCLRWRILQRKLDKIDDDVASLYRTEVGDRGPGGGPASAPEPHVWRGDEGRADDGGALGPGAGTVMA